MMKKEKWTQGPNLPLLFKDSFLWTFAACNSTSVLFILEGKHFLSYDFASDLWQNLEHAFGKPFRSISIIAFNDKKFYE